jgi:pyruvate/2-oxoglutarate dehydrogenase complex dihydrolipoamide acyltransferase (E2) component
MIQRALQSGLALAAALLLAPAWASAQEAAKAPEAAAAAAPPAPAPALAPTAESAQKLGSAVKEQLASDAAAKAAQERIDAIDDETLKLLSEYRRALADAESYGAYAKQLESQVRAQDEEMATINQQLGEVETTSREVLPLMERMLSTLKQFVDLDLPFLIDERKKRVAMLEGMMARADVSLSEKYRRIVEAYQVEMDYGRTLEAYEGKLGDAADARTVQFLRVGRIALLYQTLDGKETGYWDADNKGWVVDNAYQHGFKEGIAVAKKLVAPEMLLVPVPAPKEVKS